MKKWIKSFLLLTIISFVLAGCTSSNGDGKTLRVVTDAAYAPFEYLDGDKIVGFDVDVLTAVAEEAGYKLKFEHVGWDPVFVEILNKDADLAVSSISIREDRLEDYDFSYAYFESTNKILVREGSDIKSIEDLKGKVVAVQNGTTGATALEKVFGENNPNIKKFDSNVVAIQELLSGGADAVVADNGVVEEFAKNNPNEKLVVVEDPDAFEAEYYGIMFPKGSNLVNAFNEGLNKILDNGKYTEIYKKWFGEEPPIERLKAQQK